MSQPPRPPAPKPGRRAEHRNWSDVVSSSRQGWLAGLGALAAAQTEGAKALDALVKRGDEVERRLKREAEAKRPLPAKRPGAGRAVEPRGTEKLSLFFEHRVARAVERLGIRPATEVHKLAAEVERLSAKVEALTKQLRAAKPAATPAAKSGPPESPTEWRR